MIDAQRSEIVAKGIIKKAPFTECLSLIFRKADYLAAFFASFFFVTSYMIGVAMKIEA